MGSAAADRRAALCACAVSIHLALYQWRVIAGLWDPIFGNGSENVLDSHASEQMRRWMRIPDAALGAIGYLSEVIFGLAGTTRRWQYRPWLVLLFGLDVIPLGAVSVIAHGMVVGAWCTRCLLAAVVSLILVFLSYDEVWAASASPAPCPIRSRTPGGCERRAFPDHGARRERARPPAPRAC